MLFGRRTRDGGLPGRVRVRECAEDDDDDDDDDGDEFRFSAEEHRRERRLSVLPGKHTIA